MPKHEMEKPVIIHVNNVSKTFVQGDAKVKALKHIQFDARAGELEMIVGPSGCGKTTLLSVIAGTLRPDEGIVNVLDHFLNEMTDSEVTTFRRQNIGFIFQQFHLIPTLTVEENVCIPLLLNGIKFNESKERAHNILEKVGLKGRERGLPKMLSGGEQQRVAIARALVHEPRLVICDEPTSSLDAHTGAKIMELMVEIARCPERSVLVVTHDNRIFKFADRLAKMDDGRILSMEVNEGKDREKI